MPPFSVPLANPWPIGTYWHLATRPDELKVMPEGPLRNHATKIDQRLNQATYKTLVHGDAKIANFCFSESHPSSVAAVDFQYVGGGCGIKDVAYLISSCLSDQEAERFEESLLNFYLTNSARPFLKSIRRSHSLIWNSNGVNSTRMRGQISAAFFRVGHRVTGS